MRERTGNVQQTRFEDCGCLDFIALMNGEQRVAISKLSATLFQSNEMEFSLASYEHLG